MSLKISIITPSYNQAQFLPFNLQSIREQTHPFVEHIVVDPGSTDGSRKIAEEASGVILIAEPDRGQSDGITKGFKRATGDILVWLNSDDVYPNEDVLATVAAAFEDHPEADVIYGNVDFVDEGGKFLRSGYVNSDADNLLESFPYQVGIVQPGVFMRRSVFEKIGGPSEQYEYCMDYEYWVRIASSGFKWVHINETLANHRWWEGMKTSKGRDASLVEHMQVCTEYFGYIHWKWLDRYAEYVASKKDGVVNHGIATNPVAVSVNAQLAIHRFVSQDMLARLQTGMTRDEEDTLKYINKYAPQFKRYFWNAYEFDSLTESNKDPEAHLRPAWHINSAKDEKGRNFVSYNVPDNFHRVFDAQWHKASKLRSLERLREIAKRRRDACVIVGNGPSLAHTDLSLLSHADVIVSNFAILNPTLLDAATLLTVTNDLVAKQGGVSFNKIKKPKVAPFWLSNSINEAEDANFVDATVEPVFCNDIGGVFSWRSTVSYFNMQLAFALGYRKVLLVGFDNSYIQPKNVKEGDLIDQVEDDKNHFDPRYFKGKTWQAADTENMEAVYQIAREAFESAGGEIVNCTVGGKLEVFRRGDLGVELKKARTQRSAIPPRLLLIDHTRIGDGTATGELKAALFGDWPSERVLQLYDAGKGKVGLNETGGNAPLDPMHPNDVEKIEKKIAAFRPDAVLYRPVPKTEALHKLAAQLVDKLDLPLVTWIMDDWPTAYARENPEAAATLEADWQKLIEGSAARLCISEAMASAFEERYGVSFVAVANGIDPADWPPSSIRAEGPVRVRYAGSLADNMTMSTVRMVAEAVERLASQGNDIQFEIKTRKYWRDFAGRHFKGFSHTSMIAADLSPEEYRAWLSQSDINVIGYNFDERSKDYTRYSLANKLPECLASGAALLAVGPADVATMAVLEKFGCGLRVTSNSVEAVADALSELAGSPARRSELAQAARDVAFDHFNVADARQKLTETISLVSKSDDKNELTAPQHPRDAGAHVDETAVVAHLLSNRRGRKHVLIDVGAHFGISASYFHKLGWTIHCFEPDPANRAKLNERYAGVDSVSIDPRAVSDKPKSGVAFFTSQESTGISGLSAFRDTHEKTGRVDVTTIEKIMGEKSVSTIDFLKIDVEGFDFSVLKGVPWKGQKPDVIECEFEDAKTVPLGHKWEEIADYLAERGYTVYVSEWHPIIRYGIPHDWRRVLKYVSGLQIPSNAWGNLLAFKQDPGEEAVQAAFSALTKRRSAGAPSSSRQVRAKSSATKVTVNEMKTANKPVYFEMAERLRVRAPRLFSIARLVKRMVAGVWRRLYWIAPASILLGAIFVAGLLQSDPLLQLLISGGAVALAIFGAVMYLGSWTYHRIRALSLEAASLRTSLAADRQKAKLQRARDEQIRESDRQKLARRLDRHLNEEKQRFQKNQQFNQRIQNELNALRSSTEEMLSELTAASSKISEVEEVVAEMEEDLSSLEGDLDAARQADAASKQQIGNLVGRAAKLESEIEAKSAALNDTMHDRDTIKKELVDLEHEMSTVDQKRAVSENNLDALKKKYKELAEHSEDQGSRLQKVYENVKAARQRISSIESDG